MKNDVYWSTNGCDIKISFIFTAQYDSLYYTLLPDEYMYMNIHLYT